MSQAQLIEELEALGYRVMRRGKAKYNEKGIDILATAPNGFRLSLRADSRALCNPMLMCQTYWSLELACKNSNNELVRSPEIYTSPTDYVSKRLDHDEVMKVARTVMGWPKDYQPKRICRPKVKW